MRLLLSRPPSPILILLSSSSSHSQNLTFSRLNKPTPSPFLSPFSTLSYRFFPTLISYPRSPIFGHFSGDELRRKKFPGVKVPAMSTGAGDGDEESNGVVEFELSPSSLLKIQKGDITQWSVDGSSDAIVNAANERMLGGGGVDGAIHRAAGPELREACYKVPEVSPGVRCPVGEARITPGFRLPASHVIHTVGPIYDVDENPVASLANAYRNSLRVAKENSIHYVAFAAISCGIYGYPFDEAASVALSTIREHANDFKEVHFVLFTDDIYCVWIEKAKEIVGK